MFDKRAFASQEDGALLEKGGSASESSCTAE